MARCLNNYQAGLILFFPRRCNIWKRAAGTKIENCNASKRGEGGHSLYSLSFLFFSTIFLIAEYEGGINIASPHDRSFSTVCGRICITRACVVDKAGAMRSDKRDAMRYDAMRCPPLCHYISARGIFLRIKRESHNKRTRWKTTVSPGVNWRFEARQDRYVPATETEISFPTRGRKRVSRFGPPPLTLTAWNINLKWI